ncbi:MAG: hypothetical protein RLZZ585_6 [Bacteroidota bacterium]|jgi:hypothetical protein
MKRFLLSCSLLFTLTLFGQRYTNSVGLRFSNIGLTQINAKHYMNASNAVEVSLGGSTNYIWMQGNYEWQHPLVDDLDYYFGAGPGVGIVSGNPIMQNSANDRFMLGANGVIGLEYKLPDYPFTFAIESGPYLQIIPSLSLGWNIGLAARYVLP